MHTYMTYTARSILADRLGEIQVPIQREWWQLMESTDNPETTESLALINYFPSNPPSICWYILSFSLYRPLNAEITSYVLGSNFHSTTFWLPSSIQSCPQPSCQLPWQYRTHVPSGFWYRIMFPGLMSRWMKLCLRRCCRPLAKEG